jgi:hypothetical protein
MTAAWDTWIMKKNAQMMPSNKKICKQASEVTLSRMYY